MHPLVYDTLVSFNGSSGLVVQTLQLSFVRGKRLFPPVYSGLAHSKGFIRGLTAICFEEGYDLRLLELDLHHFAGGTWQCIHGD